MVFLDRRVPCRWDVERRDVFLIIQIVVVVVRALRIARRFVKLKVEPDRALEALDGFFQFLVWSWGLDAEF
jgi:hypothetical protein